MWELSPNSATVNRVELQHAAPNKGAPARRRSRAPGREGGKSKRSKASEASQAKTPKRRTAPSKGAQRLKNNPHGTEATLRGTHKHDPDLMPHSIRPIGPAPVVDDACLPARATVLPARPRWPHRARAQHHATHTALRHQRTWGSSRRSRRRAPLASTRGPRHTCRRRTAPSARTRRQIACWWRRRRRRVGQRCHHGNDRYDRHDRGTLLSARDHGTGHGEHA